MVKNGTFQLQINLTINYIKNNGDYFCINPKHTKILKQCCKYCYIEIPEKGKNKLKYSHGEKCIKVPFVIYPDTESLLEKINTCHK